MKTWFIDNVVKVAIGGVLTAALVATIYFTKDLYVKAFDDYVQVEAKIVLDRFVDEQLHKNIDSAMSGQKVGFRGALAGYTHLSKDRVVEILGEMILERDRINNEIDYLFAFTNFTVNRTTRETDTLGIKIFPCYLLSLD